MARTLKELAQEAIDVQNACNMGGVSRSFSEAVRDLHDAMRDAGQVPSTDAIRKHPITQMWVSKLVDLSNYSNDTFSEAYNAVRDLAAS